MKHKTLARLGIFLVVLTILDYASRAIRIFPTANGGSISFVPTILIIVAIIAKPLEGLLFGAVASIFTFMIGSQWFVNMGQYLFDYPIALGGAVMIGSLVWRTLRVINLNNYIKVFVTSLSVVLWQFISYTIALMLYVGDSKMFIKGIGAGVFKNITLFIKFNAIYMVPIIIANTILATIVLPRLKKYLF